MVKRNSTAQMRRVLQNAFHVIGGFEEDEIAAALRDVERGIERVRREGAPVELQPRRSALRRLQHLEASSAEFVGELRFGEIAKCMI